MKHLIYILLTTLSLNAQEYTNLKPNLNATQLVHELKENGKELHISSKEVIYGITIKHRPTNKAIFVNEYEVDFNSYIIPLSIIPNGDCAVIVNLQGKRIVFNIYRKAKIKDYEYLHNTIVKYNAISSVNGRSSSRTTLPNISKKDIHRLIKRSELDKLSKTGKDNTVKIYAVYDSAKNRVNGNNQILVYE